METFISGENPLYGSSDKYFGEAGTAEVKGVSKNIPQNGSRADYVYDKNLKSTALSNFAFSIRDQNARTFVMSYAVNDEGFVKTADQCPTDYQCFENAAKDKRLIVPPYEVSFNHCQALPKDECSYDPLSQLDGVMVSFKKDEEWTSYVLGGEVRYYGGEHDQLLLQTYNGVVASRMGNRYLNYDGSCIYKRHQTTYLLANAFFCEE